MSRNRLLVVLLVLIISLFTTPITFANATSDNSSNEYNISARDNQEESFTVNPLPFYNITNTGNADITYDNERISFDNEDYKHEDSTTGFNETLPDDVFYNQDPVKHLAHYGYGHYDGDTDYYDTWIDDDDYIQDSFPLLGIVYLYFNVSEYILDEGMIFSEIIYYGDDSGDGDHTVYIRIYNWDTTSFESVYTDTGVADGWHTLQESISYDSDYIHTNNTILYSISVTASIAINTGIVRVDYAFVEVTNYFSESFTDVTDITANNDPITTNGDVATITTSNDYTYDTYYWDIDGENWDNYYIEFNIKADVATGKFYLKFYTGDAGAGDIIFGITTITSIPTDWTPYKILFIGSTPVESMVMRVRSYANVEYNIDFMNILKPTLFGWQNDGSILEGFISQNEFCSLTTDGDTINFTGNGGTAYWDYWFDTTTTGSYIDAIDYPLFKYKINEVHDDNADGNVWTMRYYYDGGNYYATAYNDIAGNYYENLVAGTGGSNNRYKIRIWVNQDEWFTLDYIKIYSIANFSLYDIDDEGTDEYMYVENGTLIATETSQDYFRLMHDQPINVITSDYSIFNVSTNITSGFTFREVTDTASSHPDEVNGTLDSTVLTDWEFYIYQAGSFSSIEYFAYPNSTLRLDVTQYKNHKFEFMLEKTDTGYMNIITGSDYLNSSNSLYWYFNNDTITYGNHIVDVSGYDILRFEVDLKYTVNQYKITIKDYNNSRIESLILYDGFIKSASRFYLSLIEYQNIAYLYYLSGDFEFRTNWDYTEVSKDDDVLISLNQMAHEYGEVLTDTDVYYNMYVPSFQFYRTEIGVIDFTDYFIDPVGAEEEFNITQTLDFFYPNGSIRYKIICFISYHDEWGETNLNLFGRVVIYEYNNGDRITLYSSDGDTDTPAGYPHDIDLRAKFGVWRTQENSLGLKFTDTNTLLNEEVEPEEFTVFITDETLENFQCNITVHYELHKYLTFNDYTLITLDAMEYSYNNIAGVSEPHFSTTWWEGVPIIGAIIDGFIWVGKAIINGFGIIIDGLGAIFNGIVAGAIVILSPVIDGVTAAVTAVAAGIWGLFSGILDAIGTAIGNVAATIWGFFESVIDNIIDNLDDLILGLIDWIVEALELFIPIVIDWLSPIIEAILGLMIDMLNWIGSVFGIPTLGTDIANLITMFIDVTTSVFEFFGNLILISVSILAEIAYYITRYGGTAIMFITIYIVMDISIVAMEMDMEQVKDKFGSYINVLTQIFEIIFKIFNAVLQFIGGIIP